MKRSLVLLVSLLAVLALLGGTQALDQRNEYLRGVFSDNRSANSTISAQFITSGIGDTTIEQADGFQQFVVQLCRWNASAGGAFQMECWDGEGFGGGASSHRNIWFENGDPEVDCDFFTSTDETGCRVDNVKLPRARGLYQVHAQLEVTRSLADNSHLDYTQELNVTGNASLNGNGSVVDTHDHSFSSLDESSTNDLLLWGAVAVVSLYFGWWFPAFTASFMGVLGVFILDPPPVMKFDAVALWTLMAFWLQFILVNFGALREGTPFFGNPSPNEEERERR